MKLGKIKNFEGNSEFEGIKERKISTKKNNEMHSKGKEQIYKELRKNKEV